MPSFWILEDDWTGLICVAKKKENILQFMMTNNMLRDAELDPDTRSYAFEEWEDEEIERFAKLVVFIQNYRKIKTRRISIVRRQTYYSVCLVDGN